MCIRDRIKECGIELRCSIRSDSLAHPCNSMQNCRSPVLLQVCMRGTAILSSCGTNQSQGDALVAPLMYRTLTRPLSPPPHHDGSTRYHEVVVDSALPGRLCGQIRGDALVTNKDAFHAELAEYDEIDEALLAKLEASKHPPGLRRSECTCKTRAQRFAPLWPRL